MQLAIGATALSLIVGSGAFRSSSNKAGAIVVADSTDPAVVSFLVQANRDEIRAARAILTTTRNAEVRTFARRMVNDHGQALARVTAIGKPLGYAISDSAPNRPGTHTEDSTGVSAGPHGADHAYVDAQVAAHQQVLDQLESSAAGIKDPQLRKFVGEVQKTVKAHLAEAKRLEGALKRTST
jgi:putative membrane protein